MKIKVLNKNNNAFYEVDEAPVFVECYNETLDTGTVVISNQTDKIQISPYDIVEIYYDNNVRWKYMCVDTYTEIMTSINPKIYRYEITLFSETKQLEGVVLPNLKITKVWGETRSIFYYIKQYMDEYCPKVRIHTSVRSRVNKFSLNDDLEDKFSDECPEMQWNTPTLREVLNDLMMVADCIPVIKDCVLSYLDLTQVKNDISEDTHINYVTRSKSSEDYVSELQVNLVNVTNKTESVDNVVTRIEYVPFTVNDNEGTMNSNNILLKTKYPIYNLKSVKMMVPMIQKTQYDDTIGTAYWYQQDLMNIVENNNTFSIIYEYQEWITKDIDYLNMFNATSPNYLSEWKDYQNWSLYYTRGSNTITNFNSQLKYAVSTIVWWEEFLNKLVRNIYGVPPGAGPGVYPNTWYGMKSYYYDMVFKVEYETLEGCLFRASKNDDVEHEKVVIDNQTNSYVDSYSQGFLEYQKANRLGNEQLQINARYLPTDTLMEIGDTYEDSVIYQCQYQYFKNHIEVNALATKNYILREYFTGVKSKIRSWAIATGSEALTRHDLEKYYCEFSYSEYRDFLLDIFDYDNFVEYLISPIKNYASKPLVAAFVRTRWIDYSSSPSTARWYPDSDEYYAIDLLSRIIGNSLVLTIAFDDNYWAGKSFDPRIITPNSFELSGVPKIKDSSLKNGGIAVLPHRYTNDNGENDAGTIVFGNGIKVTSENYSDVQIGDVANGSSFDKSKYFLYNIYKRPVVNEDNILGSNYDYRKFMISYYHKKDSQEITNISTQFEFSTDTTGICFSKKWLERQQAIATSNNYHNFKIRAYDKSLYNFRNPNELPSGDYVEYNVTLKTFTTNNLTAKVEVHITSISNPIESIAENTLNNLLNNNCVYLINSDNEILIAFNNVPNSNRKIAEPETLGGAYVPYFDFYLNILRSRNKNIYDSENHYLIVNHI